MAQGLAEYIDIFHVAEGLAEYTDIPHMAEGLAGYFDMLHMTEGLVKIDILHTPGAWNMSQNKRKSTSGLSFGHLIKT